MTLYNKLRLSKAMLELLLNPERTQAVFVIGDIFRENNPIMAEKIVNRALADKNFNDLWQKKYLAPPVNLQELIQLPQNTFGYQYAQHMLDNKLEVDFFPKLKIQTPLDYFAQRARETHDIWHVLAGYSTSVIDEVSLQAFTFAQTESALSALLVAGGILGALRRDSSQLTLLFDQVTQGYINGKNAAFLLGIEFDKKWHQDITELRHELFMSTNLNTVADL